MSALLVFVGDVLELSVDDVPVEVMAGTLPLALHRVLTLIGTLSLLRATQQMTQHTDQQTRQDENQQQLQKEPHGTPIY
jgi:hypothetical protein